MTPQQIKDLQAQYSSAIAKHPAIAPIIAQNGNNADAILNAYQTGNWSSILNITGRPFSEEEQKLAVEKATAALAPGFDESKRYDESTFNRTLGNEKRAYDDYLKTSASNFETDKQTLDQNAADRGVLFSGGRVQKERNLKNTYEQDQAAKMASAGSNIAKTAGDYQYKYGDNAVNNPSLSKYYQLGGNNFNPSVARGGATPGGLSSVYNPSGQNYQGTEVNKNKASVQTRAASLLANKANKVVPYGYQNQI